MVLSDAVTDPLIHAPAWINLKITLQRESSWKRKTVPTL